MSALNQMASGGSAERKRMLSRSLEILERNWWPLVLTVYVLAFLPGGRNDYPTAVLVRYAILLLGVLGSTAFEIAARPGVRFRDARAGLVSDKSLFLALGFGALAVVSAVSSREPGLGLTGALVGSDDGALSILLFVFAFLLMRVQLRRDPDVVSRLEAAVLVIGTVLVGWGLVELALGRGLVFSTGRVPIAQSLAPGHLSGVLVVVSGVGLARLARRFTWPVMLIVAGVSFVAGTTMNRSAIIALAAIAIALLLVRFSKRSVASIAVVLVAGVAGFGSMTFIGSERGDFVPNASSLGTVQARLLFWDIAAAAIMERPVFGWGGADQYSYVWNLLVPEEVVARLLRGEHGFPELIKQVGDGSSYPLFLVRDNDGRLVNFQMTKFRVHNQVLDVAIMWGLPAALLWLALLALACVGVLRAAPISIAVLGYGVFLLFWFVPIQFEGALWILLAGAIPTAVSDGSAPSFVDT